MTKKIKCEVIILDGQKVIATGSKLTPEDLETVREFVELLRSKKVVRLDRRRKRS